MSSKNSKSNNSKKKMHPLAKKALAHIKLVREAEEKALAEEAEIARKEKEEKEKEEAIKKQLEDEKIRKTEIKQAKIAAQKEAGTYKTKSQKLKEKKRMKPISTTNIINKLHIDEIKSNEVEIPTIQFRSPIICIMGHVDTGKTKIMDKLRDSNVQEGEIGGITQQIGATFINKINIIRKINNNNKQISIPGLLMIDTPGHEAFSNLRKRGSNLADIVILVIDLVHGLEQQTIESLNILKESNTQFIIALNKIDRLYGWESIENRLIQDILKDNNTIYIDEFNNRLYDIKGQLQEQGINSELYWNNNSIDDTISICPLSAITGEGIPDLLNLIVHISENILTEQITISEQLKCIVMEKTAVDGIGITVDALLISGTLNKGDNILIRTNNGLVKTQIRNLLTPPPNCESRVTTNYDINNSLTGALGFKLIAPNLENIIISSDIIIDNDEVDIHYSSETTKQFNLEDNGILVYASSEGSLEALMHHLQIECNPPVPVSAVYIGKVMKKHINKMIISTKTDYKEINTILAFDVNVDEDIIKLANSSNITILTDGTIYRLFNQYEQFRLRSINERKDIHRHLVVYPCILNIIKDKIFHKNSPFIFGVKVIEGTIHINTPLIISNKNLIIGKVESIQNDGKNVEIATKGSEVCIKVIDMQNNYIYGRHFDFNDTIISHLTRDSIDIMKKHFKDEIITKDGKLNDTGKLLKLLYK